MADFGSPVAQNVNADPNKGLQTISNLMGLKSQQIGIQQAQQQLAGTTADTQAKTQAMTERAAITKMMQTGVDDMGNSIKDATGQLDPSRILPALGRIAPYTGQQYAQNIIKSQTDKVGLESASQSLDAQGRGLLMGAVQAAALDPNMKSADINAGIDNLVAAHPEMANAATYLKSLTPHLDVLSDPRARAGAVNTIAAHIQPGQAVQTQPTAGSVNTGATQSQGAFAPPVAGGGFTPATQVKNEIPPARQPYTDTYGVTYTFNPQTGNYEKATSAGAGGGGGGQSGAVTPSGPGAVTPGAAEATRSQTEANFANVNANRSAANLAPQQLDQIRNALAILETVNTGGDWTAKRAQIEANLSSVIPGLKSAQDDATKVQVLDKLLTRITNDSNRVLGQNASTDAQRDSIAHQNAHIGYTPPAIQSVLKYAAAQTLAMQAKGNAQDAWLKQPGNGITNQHDFEAQWRKAYDPVLFQLEVANPQEQAALIKGLPPAEAASLAAKRKALEAMGVPLQ